MPLSSFSVRLQGQAGGDRRFCYLGDSHVARSAIARGRSSSHALRPVLKKVASLCLAFGLYPAGRFCPTRLNPGDGPSRQTEIPPPVERTLLAWFQEDCAFGIYVLDRIPKIRRWTSNWTRLVLLPCPGIMSFLLLKSSWRIHLFFSISNLEWGMDFDSTLLLVILVRVLASCFGFSFLPASLR